MRVTWTFDTHLGLNSLRRWSGVVLDRVVGQGFEAGLNWLAALVTRLRPCAWVTYAGVNGAPAVQHGNDLSRHALRVAQYWAPGGLPAKESVAGSRFPTKISKNVDWVQPALGQISEPAANNNTH